MAFPGTVFLYFRLNCTADSKYKLLRPAFEPWIRDIGSNHSSNCTTTTAQLANLLAVTDCAVKLGKMLLSF